MKAEVVAVPIFLLLTLTAVTQTGASIPTRTKESEPRGARLAILLVTADLDCEWTVDGVPQGQLKTDEIKKLRLSRGEHLVRAVSADKRDQWQATVTVVEWQKTLQISLNAIRQIRKAKEQKDAEERKVEEAHKVDEAQRVERAEKIVWSDPDTALMWTRQNNGYDLNWAQAQDFCSHLDLGGYRDWRLPTINELAAIYDERQNEPHIKGGIRIEERWIWSSAVGTSSLTGSSPFFTAPYQQGKSDQKALSFGFLNGARYASWVDESYMQRALCVRRAD